MAKRKKEGPAAGNSAGLFSVLTVRAELAADDLDIWGDLEPAPRQPVKRSANGRRRKVVPRNRTTHPRSPHRKRIRVRKGAPKTGRSPTGKKVPGQKFKNPLGKAKRPKTGQPEFDSAIMSMAAYLREAQHGVSSLLRVYRNLHDSQTRLRRWSERADRMSGQAMRKNTARKFDRLADEFSEAADKMQLAYRKVEHLQDDLEYFIDTGIAVTRKLMESQDKKSVAQAKRLSRQLADLESLIGQPKQLVKQAVSRVRAIRNPDRLSPRSAVESAVKASDTLHGVTQSFHEMLGMLYDSVLDMVEAAS